MKGLIFGIVSVFVMVLLLATVIIPAVDNSYERETMENPDPTLSLEKYYRTIFFNTTLDLEVTDAGDDQITVRSDSDTQTVDFGPMIITAADNSSIFIDDYDHIICIWSDQGAVDYVYLELPVTAVTSGDIVTISSNGSSFTIPKPNEYLYKPLKSGQFGSYDHGDLWTTMNIAVGYFGEPVYNDMSYSGLLKENINESGGQLHSITWDAAAVVEDNILQSRIMVPQIPSDLSGPVINVLGAVPTPTYTDGDWGYELDGDEATIVSYSGSPGNITVPSTVGGYDVVKFGKGGTNNVFDTATIINSTVTLPGSILTIDNGAFRGCTGITAITLNEGLQTIVGACFNGCTGLTSIIFPSTVTTMSGTSAFDGCSSLSSVTLNEGLQNISGYAFRGTALTSIDIPSTVTLIDSNCFLNVTTLTSVTLNEGLQTIGNSAFKGCTGLTSITIPSTVTSMASAFYGCTGLTSAIVKSTDISNASNMFYQCTGITDVTLSEGITKIDTSMFRGCTSLTSVNIPSTVTSIGNQAFQGCSSLINIALPPALTSIGSSAFYQTALKSITIPSTVTSISSSAIRPTPTLQQILNLSNVTLTTSMTGSPLPAIDDHIDAAAYIAYKEPSILKPGSQYNAFISIIPIVVVLLILVGAAVLIISRRE